MKLQKVLYIDLLFTKKLVAYTHTQKTQKTNLNKVNEHVTCLFDDVQIIGVVDLSVGKQI